MMEKQILTAEIVDGGLKIDVDNMEMSRVLCIAISLIVHVAAVTERDGGQASEVWQLLNDKIMDRESWEALVLAAMADLDEMEGKQDGN